MGSRRRNPRLILDDQSEVCLGLVMLMLAFVAGVVVGGIVLGGCL